MGGFTSSLPAWFELTRGLLLVVTSGLADVGNRKRLLVVTVIIVALHLLPHCHKSLAANLATVHLEWAHG
jgi:hypothetical protein